MKTKAIIDAWTLFHSLFKKGDEVWVITDEDDFIWGKLLDFNDEECELRFRGKEVWFRWDCIRFISHDGFPVRSLTGADGSRSILKEIPVAPEKVGQLRSILSGEVPDEVLNECIGELIKSSEWIYGEKKKQCLLCRHIGESIVKENGDVRIWCETGDKVKYHSPDIVVGCRCFEPSGKKRKLGHYSDYEGDYGGSISMGRSTAFGDPFLIENTKMTLINQGNRGEYFEDHLYEEVIVCEAMDGAKGLLYDLETVYMF